MGGCLTKLNYMFQWRFYLFEGQITDTTALVAELTIDYMIHFLVSTQQEQLQQSFKFTLYIHK